MEVHVCTTEVAMISPDKSCISGGNHGVLVRATRVTALQFTHSPLDSSPFRAHSGGLGGKGKGALWATFGGRRHSLPIGGMSSTLMKTIAVHFLVRQTDPC